MTAVKFQAQAVLAVHMWELMIMLRIFWGPYWGARIYGNYHAKVKGQLIEVQGLE